MLRYIAKCDDKMNFVSGEQHTHVDVFKLFVSTRPFNTIAMVFVLFFLLLNVAVAVERSRERERRRCESVTYTYTYAESEKPSASSEWIQLYPVVLIHKPNWTICNLDFQWNGHRCGECASIDLIKNRTIVDVLANHCTNRINSCYNSFGFDMILIIIMI